MRQFFQLRIGADVGMKPCHTAYTCGYFIGDGCIENDMMYSFIKEIDFDLSAQIYG